MKVAEKLFQSTVTVTLRLILDLKYYCSSKFRDIGHYQDS